MRILDIELQDILNNMSQEELDKLDKALYDVKRNSMHSININELFDSEHVQQAIEKAGRPDLSNNIDDDKAISEIKNEDEKMIKKAIRAPIMPGGAPRSVRSIPEKSIKNLIRRAKVMNSGAKYMEGLKGKSLEELEAIEHKQSMSSEEKNKIDPKYGINEFDKREIEYIMKAKAYAKEVVTRLPEKQFGEIKSRFENMRNEPGKSYSDPMDEMRESFNSLFGEGIMLSMEGNLQMVDLAEAFDGREKKMEAKQQSNFFNKIKSFFKSFGKKKDSQKALPGGQDMSSNQDARNTFIESNRVSPKDSKYQTKNAQSNASKTQTRLGQSTDDKDYR